MSLLVITEGKSIPITQFVQKKLESVKRTHEAKEVTDHKEFQEEVGKSSEKVNFQIKKYEKISTQKKHNLKAPKWEYVKNLMTASVKTLSPTATVKDAKLVLEMYAFKHIPILEKNKLVGIVSDRNLIGVSEQISLNEIMSKEVIVTYANTDILSLAQVMLEYSISGVPVIDNNEQLVGIITKTDLLIYLTLNMELLAQA